jgi:hypothetical protein
MIEILTPILDNNCIVYPVKINTVLYNFEIKYSSENRDNFVLSDNIDGIVPMFVSIAICNKIPIVSQHPIDIELYNNLMKIQDIYKKYHSKHSYLLSMIKKDEINLVLDMPTCNRKNMNPVGLNANITPISMGIDSLHTILTNIDSVTHLIYINKLDNSNTINTFYSSIVEHSKNFNKELIYSTSNFKEIMCNLELHGTNYGVFTNDFIILASCYPLGIKTMYFSGLGGDIPCLAGQHSEINQYLNSNEFINIHNNTARIKKIKYIIQYNPELLNKIRVCNDDISEFEKYNIAVPNILNCSVCEKCARTLAYIYMLGYYEKAITFYKPDVNFIDYYMENYYNRPKKIMADKYDDLALLGYLDIYNKNNNSIYDILDKYDDGKFIGEEFIIGTI